MMPFHPTSGVVLRGRPTVTMVQAPTAGTEQEPHHSCPCCSINASSEQCSLSHCPGVTGPRQTNRHRLMLLLAGCKFPQETFAGARMVRHALNTHRQHKQIATMANQQITLMAVTRRTRLVNRWRAEFTARRQSLPRLTTDQGDIQQKVS